jgi:hypothetical protein
MKRFILFFLLLMTTLLSCSKDDNKMYFVTAPMYITGATLPDTVSLGQSINFQAISYLPSSCERYSQMDVKARGLEVDVTMFMLRDIRQTVCLDVVTEVVKGGSFYPAFAGTYTFNFARGTSSVLEKTVVVR